jgi:enamine deaminase RidA (YjgF/YER057c/UK114 family)
VTESVHGEPPHRVVDPASLAKPVGYAHAVVAAPGRTVHLSGQVGWDRAGAFPPASGGLVAQVDRALESLLVALREAGGAPEHVVSMRVHVLSAAAWRADAKAIGAVWRARMGRWYPAMTLVQVAGLYEPEALVEIDAVAVVPDARSGSAAR